MENHQPKKQEIPLIEDITEIFDLPQPSIQPMIDEKLDSYLNKIIRQSVPPFLLTKFQQIKQQIKQEQDSAEIESKHIEDKISNNILKYNRKKKSLATLTQKFITKFQGNSPNIIVLDKVTEELQVERRRLYDIINIMESLNVVSKNKKNIYEWKGLKRAVETLNNIHNRFEIEEAEKSRKQKSLESLATELLKLISLNSKSFSLQQAARIILKQSNSNQIKAKVRRFYDIVNVFKSLKLVQKIKVPKECGGGKSHYKWLGSEFLQKIIEQKANGNTNFQEMDESSSENSDKFQNIENINPQSNLKTQNKTKYLKETKGQNIVKDISNIQTSKTSIKQQKKIQKAIKLTVNKKPSSYKAKIQKENLKKSFTFCSYDKNYIQQNSLKIQIDNFRMQHDSFKIEIHEINPSSSYFCNLIKRFYPFDNYTNADLSQKVIQNLWP